MSRKVHGIFNICKPRGYTSFDVVARVRRIAGERRVGHTGTLDPEAVGVLPVCVGQATRVAEYLTEATKEYGAEIRLGVTSDTYDATGNVVPGGETAGLTMDQIEAALGGFRGRSEQVPPMYSAIKQEGRRLYDLARAGQTVERRPRVVEISRLEIVAWEPPSLFLHVECSKGTYIRSLAHDLGTALGCGAILQSLVRLRTGPFRIADSLSLDDLELAFALEYWPKLMHPLDEVVLDWPAVVVDRPKEQAIAQGKTIDFGSTGQRPAAPWGDDAGGGALCRAYTVDGRFIAVLEGPDSAGGWHPKKVFLEASPAEEGDGGPEE